MVIRGTRVSLARARAIRSARRSRSGKVLSRSSARNTSSRLKNSSKTQNTAETKQTKKIAMYEEVQKAADDLQKTAKALLDIGTVKKETGTTTSQTTAEGTSDTAAQTKTEATTQPKEKTEEEQKKEIISGVKDLVEQYNTIYENLEELGGTVNTVFLSRIKQLVGNCEKELEKTGVSLNRNGTLSITTKTLESTDLNTLKSVYCTSNGLTDKLIERAEYIESNAASTIEVMNRMYGTQTTYNKYGAGSTYYGSSGSWYNAIG